MPAPRYRHIVWDWNGTLHDLDVAQPLGVDRVPVAAGRHPAPRLRARRSRVGDNLAALRELVAYP